MEYKSIHDFLLPPDTSPIIDVRSPAEYERGHIPGAINIPLFNNSERAEVGTIYKQHGKNRAIKKGLKIVGPRMVEMIETVENLNPGKVLRIYCWRGGMRSSSMAWLFETAGYNCLLLKRGYKSYRGLANSIFEHQEIILIGGETGSGKTEVLKELELLGEQVVDLEGLANHRGSAFGSIGMPEQPTNENFQNKVIKEFLSLDPAKRIFLEDESAHIGRVSIPEPLWFKMKSSPVIHLKVSLESRVKRLVKDYSQDNIPELEVCIRKIERKLGGQNLKAALDLLHSGDMASVARLLLNYYDKSYRFLLDRKKENILETVSAIDDKPVSIAQNIVKKLDQVTVHGTN